MTTKRKRYLRKMHARLNPKRRKPIKVDPVISTFRVARERGVTQRAIRIEAQQLLVQRRQLRGIS